MKKTLLTLLVALLLTAPIWAEEIPAVEIDSITADTIFHNPDPEWYVAPISYDSLMSRHNAPRRAAANCPIDSVLTFDVDSNLVAVTMYEYGDTTRTMTWAVNPDGSRVGQSREESATTTHSSYTATYEWDDATNNWKGLTRNDIIFNDAHVAISRTIYDWVNNAWLPKNRYTYGYDGAGRENEYITYSRNANNELVPTNGIYREWYNSSKKIFEIQYNAHNGASWSAGTKKVWNYDGSGNQILYEYYSSYAGNDNWVGSSKEIGEWQKFGSSFKQTFKETYTWSNEWVNSTRDSMDYNASGSQTLKASYKWKNGTWSGTAREIWNFNNSNKQTLHEKFSYSTDWYITLREIKGYDAAGNNDTIENYSFTNGVKKGTKRELYKYNSSKKKVITVTYTWNSSEAAWVNKDSTMASYVIPGTTITESCKYSWNNAWVGSGNRTLASTITAAGKTTSIQVTQIWPTNSTNWQNKDSVATESTNSKTTKAEKYTWLSEHWQKTSRSEWHYNTAGLNDTIKTYAIHGAEDVDSLRTVNIYQGTKIIMTHNAQWNGVTWIMTSMTRTDDVDRINELGIREVLNASWHCGSDSVWIGDTKDTTAYSSTGKMLYSAHYTSWANEDWLPAYKFEYEYDESDNKVLEQRFDWIGNKWQGHYRDEYLYDAQGRQTMYAYYNNWNNTLDKWVGSTKYEYVYGANGQYSQRFMYTWRNNQWEAIFLYNYTYDSANREIEQLVMSNSNGEWQNNQKYIKEYKGSKIVKDNIYFWQDESWEFSSRRETYYDIDAQAKLRREVNGSWNNGVVSYFTDIQYFYDCDHPYYTIRFENYDGTLLQSKDVKETKTPKYTGETPIRPASNQYTYIFKGWTPAIAIVTGNATYTAVYDSIENQYTITFNNNDGTELQRVPGAYGVIPTYTGETPAKPATTQYTYTFMGWNPELAPVTGDASYTAEFDSTAIRYAIVFNNYDGSELKRDSLVYGATPAYTGTEPTKQATAQYVYNLIGWNPELAIVTGDAVYTAEYDSTLNKYLITFVNYDGTELQSTEVLYGSMPSYPDETPAKPRSDQYTYTFKGWTPEVVTVTAAATYTAEFDSIVNKYMVSFVNYDGTELQSTEVAYGSMPSYPDETPTKPRSDQYTYTFKGWTPEVVTVTAAAVYTAEFDSTVNTYLVTWLNEDGSEIDHATLEYGATPMHDDPTKAATAEYTYTFAGWTPEVAAVGGNATYRATFTATKNKYTVTFANYDGSVLKSSEEEYGTMPQYTGGTPNKPSNAQYTYIFNGWSPAITSVTGEATYTAQFDSIIHTYTVIFYYEDSVTELDRVTVAYGETPHTDMVPSIPGDAQYTYVFAGWSPNVEPATGDASYTATYDRILKQYTITFKNYNGQVLQSVLTDYGTIPAYTGEEPTKKGNVQYTYTFTGWTPELVAVTGEATYTAVFEEVVNTYIVIFYDEDGLTELDRQEVEYGQKPVYGGETPTKAEDEEYTYTFAGWSPKITKVTGDATYRATYTATKKTNGLSPVTGNPSPVTVKVLIDGHIFIRRGTHLYTLDGVLVD